MKAFTIDIEYLCQKMSDMSGLPIRIFENSELKKIYCVVPLIVDPLILFQDELMGRTQHVSYYISSDSDYYGIICSDPLKIIIGPSRQNQRDRQELKDLAFHLNVPARNYESFALSMKAIVPMPLDSVIQMMCTLNHVLNGEKLNVSDFQIKETETIVKFDYEMPVSASDIYKSYNIENQIADIVRSGDTGLLERWIREAPTVRSGTLSTNLLRQNRNTLIVNATLVSRVAISCGMDVSDAFKLSDSFIRRCENARDLNEINALQYELVHTYTREVGMLKQLGADSGLKNEICSYILHHLSEPITTEKIAAALYMS
ncbi:MAG: hypothetical protein IKS69_07670, partial [Erysipelotrichaceae bacterium]|nr:hypothetical protein [Erysipelotrichaceae bacterium]